MNKFIIIVLLLAALPAVASARGHVSIGVGYGGGYYPGYYEPAYPAYYYPRPVYVEPAPVIVEQVQPYGNYARPAAPPVYYDRPEPRYNRDDQYCREFTRNVKINGHLQQSYGTACQQPDGSWQTVN